MLLKNFNKIFFLYKNHIRFAKKSFPVQFCVLWPNLKPSLSTMSKKTHRLALESFLKISNQSSDSSSIYAERNSFVAWKSFLINFSILQLWRTYQSTCDQSRRWPRKLTLRTKIYSKHVVLQLNASWHH